MNRLLLLFLLVISACSSTSFDRKNPAKDPDKVGRTFFEIFKNRDEDEYRSYFSKEIEYSEITNFKYSDPDTANARPYGNSPVFDWENTEYSYTEFEEYDSPEVSINPSDFGKKELGFKIYFREKNASKDYNMSISIRLVEENGVYVLSKNTVPIPRHYEKNSK